MNIQWQIEQLSCYPQEFDETDVVFSAAWRVNGELTQDGTTYFATVYGSQSIAPYTKGATFIPYADLTMPEVIGWVQNAMGESQVAAINANIEAQIENQVNPPTTNPPLPWVSA
jgi:hypothetical protein